MTSTIDRWQRLKPLRAVSVGNALEWFNRTLYGIFSVYLARNLFDNTDKTSALLAAICPALLVEQVPPMSRPGTVGLISGSTMPAS